MPGPPEDGNGEMGALPWNVRHDWCDAYRMQTGARELYVPCVLVVRESMCICMRDGVCV